MHDEKGFRVSSFLQVPAASLISGSDGAELGTSVLGESGAEIGQEKWERWVSVVSCVREFVLSTCFVCVRCTRCLRFTVGERASACSNVGGAWVHIIVIVLAIFVCCGGEVEVFGADVDYRQEKPPGVSRLWRCRLARRRCGVGAP